MPSYDNRPDRALLIGIDRYLQGQHKGGHAPEPLQGAVSDAQRMEDFLIRRLGVQGPRIQRLLAPRTGIEVPEAKLPTYAAMVTAWKQLIAQSREGEQVLIHYAGHGLRLPTAFPELAEDRSHDEALVPYDYATDTGIPLRDVEVRYLLHQLAAKGVFVTLILDCCHAGGVFRRASPERDGPGTCVVRSLRCDGDLSLPLGTAVAERAALVTNWHERQRDRSRPSTAWAADPAAAMDHHWLPGGGSVILAACGEHRKAVEYRLGRSTAYGLFSYHLIQALEQHGTGLSWSRLLGATLGPVGAATETSQRPVLSGPGQRQAFSATEHEETGSVAVLAIDKATGELWLEGGKADGVTAGAVIDLYPIDADNLQDPGRRIGRARVLETKDGECRCQPEEPIPGLTAGARAVLSSPGPLRRFKLSLPEPSQPELAEQLDRLTETVQTTLRDQADLQLLTSSGGWQLADPQGELLPYVDAVPRDRPQDLAAQLQHIARFTQVQGLAGKHGIAAKATVELLASGGHNSLDGDNVLDSHNILDGHGRAEVSEGTELRFRLRNHGRQSLYACILGLTQRWEVLPFWPNSARGHELPGNTTPSPIPLTAGLHQKRPSYRDLFLVFLTSWPGDFRNLLLPDIQRCKETFRGPAWGIGLARETWSVLPISLSITPRPAIGHARRRGPAESPSKPEE